MFWHKEHTNTVTHMSRDLSELFFRLFLNCFVFCSFVLSSFQSLLFPLPPFQILFSSLQFQPFSNFIIIIISFSIYYYFNFLSQFDSMEKQRKASEKEKNEYVWCKHDETRKINGYHKTKTMRFE